MNAKQLYETGQLADAIAAAGDEVKHHPADAGKRMFLCELLCFAGQTDRADRQLDTLAQQDPKAMMEVATFRQILRAEQARQQFYAEGRLPEFLEPPSERLKRHLEASVCIREGKPGDAAQILRQVETVDVPAALSRGVSRILKVFVRCLQ